MTWRSLALAFLSLVNAEPGLARDRVVHDLAQLNAAIAVAAPGDQVILANGIWRDADIAFAAQGTARRPVTLRAMTPGKVILSGASTLRIAGRHLIVRDLIFRAGHPLAEAAIVTRIGSRWSENLRLTGIVIDGFSNPERRTEDHWLALYGRDIRVDRSLFQGKQNAGAMLIVVRLPGWPLDNRVRIDRNYFGPRPLLGSNGGETIRIGTSEESLSASGSVIERNIFERCDGEVEIVSIKSGGNTIRRNLFLRSQGALVLRHGNGNLVEANVFLGMGQANTGGVRVINRDQIVRNNYMEGLAGSNFTAALSLMNGVPNSAINRYHQVVGGAVANNTLIEPAAILFGAGASAERSAAPLGITMADNLVVVRQGGVPFRIDSSTSGIGFSGNVTDAATRPDTGFMQRPVALRRAGNGLLYPVDPTLAATGAPRNLTLPRRTDVGPPWYLSFSAKPAPLAARFQKVVSSDALVIAVANARDGDVIDLGSGQFELDEALPIRSRITLTGNRARLSFRGDTLFAMQQEGSLALRGLDISGSASPRSAGNAVIRTAARGMLSNYTIDIADCRFVDLAHAPGFDLVATTAGTFAEAIRLSRVEVSDLSGAVVAAASEQGSTGLYPVEEIALDRLRLVRVGQLADVLRRGTDESTFGPRFSLTESQVTDSGGLSLSGVQITEISRNNFLRSGGIVVTHSVGEPLTRMTGNRFDATPLPVVRELHYTGPARAEIRDNHTL